jgi:hypothetical protein
MASTNAMTTEPTASTNNNQPPKRLPGTPLKVERRWSQKILRNIHRDLKNSSRQPTSRHRPSSTKAQKQPLQLQPHKKQWGSTFRPRGSLSAVWEAKVGLGSATEPPRHLNLAVSALPTPSCLDSRGFHIFIGPPSPAGDSKGQPNTPHDSRLIQVHDQVGKTGHPEHNAADGTKTIQFFLDSGRGRLHRSIHNKMLGLFHNKVLLGRQGIQTIFLVLGYQPLDR